MHNKALKSLVVSLFCFAFCAWAAGLVKPSADVESNIAEAQKICSLPGTKPNCNAVMAASVIKAFGGNHYAEEGALIAAVVLFGFAGLVAFVGVFRKDSSSPGYGRF